MEVMSPLRGSTKERPRRFAWVWAAFVLWQSFGSGEWNALQSFETQAKCVAQAQGEVKKFAAVLETHWDVYITPDNMSFLAYCEDYWICLERTGSHEYRCLPAGTPPVIK